MISEARLSKKDGYKRPKKTMQDKLTAAEIKEKLEDYCALLLQHKDIDKELETMGLGYLQCGNDTYLDSRRDGLVAIFGHPSDDAAEENGRCPLRLSFGKETSPYIISKFFPQLPQNEIDNSLFYDNDTLRGNSGSPVIGRGDFSSKQAFYVKGIHISSTKLKNTNQL